MNKLSPEGHEAIIRPRFLGSTLGEGVTVGSALNSVMVYSTKTQQINFLFKLTLLLPPGSKVATKREATHRARKVLSFNITELTYLQMNGVCI